MNPARPSPRRIRLRTWALLACLTATALCSSACNKEKSTAADSPAALKEAFKGAQGDTKALADQVADSSGQDATKAFLSAQALSVQQDLTPEQRRSVGQSMAKLSKQLQEEANRGNQDAAETLNNYRKSK